MKIKKCRGGERTHLEGLITDLTEGRDNSAIKMRRQADSLRIKNGQLRTGAEEHIRSEEQIHILTTALEFTEDGIFIIDFQKPGFPIIYANRSFQWMTGYTKNEILGRNIILFNVAATDPGIAKEIEQAMNRGKTFHREVLSHQKNGKKYWILLRITPVRGLHGVVTHFIGIQTDITSIRERELQIDSQREELLHVTRVGKLAEFVSSLAHEICQPLSAILMYAEASKRMLAGREPEIQKILAHIISDDKRANEVIQRMRLLLKKSDPERKPIDINVLINDTIAVIATDAAIRNDVIKIKLDSGLPLIYGDRIRLQQVLLNLVSNSFDALEGRHGKREILIHTSRKDAGTILVKVNDSGCGISKKNIPKLFTRFFTNKPDGLGMGLSISRSIVEEHGGRLDVESNPGRGATFYFTIPVGTKRANE